MTRYGLLQQVRRAARRGYLRHSAFMQRFSWRLGTGLLITIAGMAVIELMEAYLTPVPNPSLVLLMAVVLAAALGGTAVGLISCAAILAYFVIALPEQSLYFDRESVLRFIFLALCSPVAALVIGVLKDLADRNFYAVEAAFGRHRHSVALAQEKASLSLQRAERQREAAESTSRAALATLRAVVDASPVAIIALDLDYRVTMWNRAAVQMTGYTLEEAFGRIYPLVPEDWETFKQRFDAISRGAVVRDLDVVRRRKDGKPIEIRFSAAPLHDRDGAVLGIVCVAEDVTEKRSMQRQLVQAQKMEAVGRLTGGIAHDFNNLLSIAIGNLDLLELQLGDNAEAQELVESALKANLRGAELTRQLLAFARKQPLQPRPINLNEVVANMTTLLRRTLGEPIQISLRKAHDLWLAEADPVQVESALTNLAINARDAMPQGGRLTIETRNAQLDEQYAAENPEVKPGDYAMLAVSDTGTGIPPEILDRVFDPFFTTKGEGKGTGLGLSMIYGFAKQSGGHVKIYSEVGHGTTVRLYLPHARTAAEAAQLPGAVSASAAGETILVVEDNPGVRAVVTKQLHTLGYRVLEVGNATAALEALRSGEPVDLLFSDVVMPGSTGIELAAEAKRLRPDLKVLLTSGFAEEAMRNGHAVQDIPFLSKPYQRHELARKIAEVLRGDMGED